jgi:peptide/nickel transport system permease protein
LSTTSRSLSQLALHRFKKNFWGVLSFAYICLCTLAAIFAYTFIPDNSRDANQMHLPIHSKAPGFSVEMLHIPSSQKSGESWLSRQFFGTQNPGTEIAISDYKIDANQLTIYPYSRGGKEALAKTYKISETFPRGTALKKIENDFIESRYFILGTDKYGRDMLSRLILGMRISLSIGFVAVAISLIIGISLGAFSGYFSGAVDNAIMWLINVTWSIPTLLLVIAITLALGKGFWQVFIAVGLTMWVEVARVVRGQVKSVKEMQYVTAARTLGFKNLRIIRKHILPNVLAPVVVISAANFASAILVESGLSFLGIGAQPPMPSWGAMIKDHYSYIILGKPYLALVPGLAIMSLVMAFMLMGNALRDAFDVKAG